MQNSRNCSKAVQSPGLSRKFESVVLTSPLMKRKAKKEVASSSSKISRKENLEIFNPNSQNSLDYENNLHMELISLYKSKLLKNKEKIPSMVEQTFNLRRLIIESKNTNFSDLLEKFEYLIHLKNVIINFCFSEIFPSLFY